MAAFWEQHIPDRIIGVGWGGAKILVFYLRIQVTKQNEGSPPDPADYTFTISGGGLNGDILTTQLIESRLGASGAAPTISETVTAAMLAYYAAWSYIPYKLESDVSHSSGGGYWFINLSSGGVHPDFVFSPYASAADAQAYIDAQHVIYPEYDGNSYIIAFFPAFDTYSQTTTWAQLTFINLAALPKNASGDILFDFAGTGDAGDLNLEAGIFHGTNLDFSATEENDPAFPLTADAAYSFGASDPDSADISGIITVHPGLTVGSDDPPSITGPDSPGGGPIG